MLFMLAALPRYSLGGAAHTSFWGDADSVDLKTITRIGIKHILIHIYIYVYGWNDLGI